VDRAYAAASALLVERTPVNRVASAATLNLTLAAIAGLICVAAIVLGIISMTHKP
jgi:hypothetical protein